MDTNQPDFKKELKWYVVRTFSGHENKVKNFLESEIAWSSHSAIFEASIFPTRHNASKFERVST